MTTLISHAPPGGAPQRLAPSRRARCRGARGDTQSTRVRGAASPAHRAARCRAHRRAARRRGGSEPQRHISSPAPVASAAARGGAASRPACLVLPARPPPCRPARGGAPPPRARPPAGAGRAAGGRAPRDVNAEAHAHHERDPHGHGHSHGLVDDSIKRSGEGLRAVALALLILGVTAAAQVVVFVLSGSVALLADLIHNVGDAATAIPLGIAFALRSARAERWAGLAVVAAIFVSACVAGYEAIVRLIDPQEVRDLGALAI